MEASGGPGAPEAGGVLVMRAWVEPGAEPRLRVRVVSRVNVLDTSERVRAFTDEAGPLAEVVRWLALVDEPGPDPVVPDGGAAPA